MNSSETPATVGPSSKGRGRGSSTGLLLAFVLILAAGAYYFYVLRTEGNAQSPDELQALKPLISDMARYRTLDPRYKDEDGDLVADPPADAMALRDPAELRFVGIPSDFADDPEAGAAYWKDLTNHLAQATGKPVLFASEVKSFDDQLTGLKDGHLHITAFTTGQVPAAVNSAGFVPLVCPASDDGKYAYQMEILVRPASAIQSPKDLKGRTIAFSALSSNSGSRAPLVILAEEFHLLPGRDYQFLFTGDQLRSLQMLKADRVAAVCVANDFFQRMLADPRHELKAEDFRSIYKSESFPPLCFGVAYDLKPELRAKIEEGLKSFRIAGSSVKRPETRFAPVNYKLDWAYVRQVDAALSRLLETPR